MDLISVFVRLPVQAVALLISSLLTIGMLVLARRIVHRWLYVEFVIWAYTVAGITISWLYCVRVAGNPSASGAPLERLPLLVTMDLLMFHLWAPIWGFSALWFSNDVILGTAIRKEMVLAICSGAVLAAANYVGLRLRDRRYAAHAERT